MPRGPTTFRRRDVAAAMAAVLSTGAQVARVEIDREGKIVVVIGEPGSPPIEDEVDRQIAAFRAKHERV